MAGNVPKRILIVGGGTAGWMAANILLAAWGQQGTEISLVESPDVDTIGVGEGSTPLLKRFFALIGVSEAEWMPACNATYKSGIRFSGWSTKPGYSSYFHPFFSTFDQRATQEFFQAADQQRAGQSTRTHPDGYFLNNQLALESLAPVPASEPLSDQIEYGYHFDSALLGRFLRDRAVELGLRHYLDHVTSVAQSEDGSIAKVSTRKSGDLCADLYIDCTGFARLLIGKVLGEQLIPFKENLFNDSALAVQTPLKVDAPIAPETQSSALSAGWVWKIPLYNRWGNGYVYSSEFLSPDGAETEFRRHLGLLEEDVTVRRLNMPVGRIENHWKKNCLAVGLSQGFIEPLEATALMTTQATLENIIAYLGQAPQLSEALQKNYNSHVNNMIEGIRDYIVAHFRVNSRDDTDYWRACRMQSQPSDALASLLKVWDSGGDFLAELYRQGGRQIYDARSWYCLLSGYGRLPGDGAGTEQYPKGATLGYQDFIRQQGQVFQNHRTQLDKLYATGS